MAKSQEELLAEISAKLDKNAAAASGGGGIGAFSGLTKGLNEASGAVNPFVKVIEKAGEAFSAVKSAIDQNIGTWQGLSQSGMTFNGDIVSMSAAASGARVNLNEFASVLQNNVTGLIGLGSSASQSAIMFGKLSKEMFDSGITDELTRLGMTSKDINETLAVQVGFQRSTLKDTQESRTESIIAAKELATEMDAMAKLTGKSRKEQEDAMKKAQADMQVEAKFRLIGAQKGPEAEAEARKIYAQQYNEAQLRGQGQMFKEVFATGHVMSQEAATQRAMLGEQALATERQARATADGNKAAADKANEEARIAAVQNGKDVGKLQLAVYGDQGGQASKVLMENMRNTQGFYEAERKIRQEAAFKNASAEVVDAEIMRRIKNEQANKDAKTGKDIAGAGTTEAILQLQNRTKDVSSALMNGLVKPLNDDIGPRLKGFSDKFLSPTVYKKSPSGEVIKSTTASAIESSIKKGYEAGKSAEGGKSAKENIKARNGGDGYVGANAIEGAGQLVGASMKLGLSGLDKLGLKAPETATSTAPATASSSTTQTTPSEKKATLDDVVNLLEKLNTSMKNVSDKTEQLNDNAGRQVRATKNLSNDRFRSN